MSRVYSLPSLSTWSLSRSIMKGKVLQLCGFNGLVGVELEHVSSVVPQCFTGIYITTTAHNFPFHYLLVRHQIYLNSTFYVNSFLVFFWECVMSYLTVKFIPFICSYHKNDDLPGCMRRWPRWRIQLFKRLHQSYENGDKYGRAYM